MVGGALPAFILPAESKECVIVSKNARVPAASETRRYATQLLLSASRRVQRSTMLTYVPTRAIHGPFAVSPPVFRSRTQAFARLLDSNGCHNLKAVLGLGHPLYRKGHSY